MLSYLLLSLKISLGQREFRSTSTVWSILLSCRYCLLLFQYQHCPGLMEISQHYDTHLILHPSIITIANDILKRQHLHALYKFVQEVLKLYNKYTSFNTTSKLVSSLFLALMHTAFHLFLELSTIHIPLVTLVSLCQNSTLSHIIIQLYLHRDHMTGLYLSHIHCFRLTVSANELRDATENQKL